MKPRALLTSIWLLCFVAAVLLVEGYFLMTDAHGNYLLIPKDRVPVYEALGAIYGGHISVILGAWFVRPFRLPQKVEYRRYMTWLAIGVTVVYNLILLNLLAQGYLDQTSIIGDILARVKTVAGLFAFLTAPVNAYYFGAKAGDS